MNTLFANQAFDAMLVALGMAIAGYIQLRTKQVAQGEKLNAVADAQKQAAGGPTTTVVNVPAAGARPPLVAPAYNQLNDPLPDGAQDPYAQYDCGEECVSMVAAVASGLVLPAYIIRMLLGQAGGQQGTTGPQLVWLLARLKVPAHTRQCDAATAYIEWQHSYAAKFLVIARGYWVEVGYPHWILIRRTDEGGITYNDPFGGTQKWMSKADAHARYLGDYVHIDAVTNAAVVEAPQ